MYHLFYVCILLHIFICLLGDTLLPYTFVKNSNYNYSKRLIILIQHELLIQYEAVM